MNDLQQKIENYKREIARLETLKAQEADSDWGRIRKVQIAQEIGSYETRIANLERRIANPVTQEQLAKIDRFNAYCDYVFSDDYDDD